MGIKDIFIKNNIIFHSTDIPHTTLFHSLPESVAAYLNCMGKTIKLHETEYGSAWTVLYNIEEILNCQETICSENSLLVIGNGLNGDLLTVNLNNCHIGYIFSDDLWEENYDTIEDIYCELPFGIETFLHMAFEDDNYPIDGTMAEELNTTII